MCPQMDKNVQTETSQKGHWRRKRRYSRFSAGGAKILPDNTENKVIGGFVRL